MSKELECIKVKSFGDSYVVISVCKKKQKNKQNRKKTSSSGYVDAWSVILTHILRDKNFRKCTTTVR